MATAPDRRVRKTKAAIRDAFLAVVLERGYENVTIEDIVDEADIARATFYAHYRDKDHLLTALFDELTAVLTSKVGAATPGSPEGIGTSIVVDLYAHAEEHRDLYLVFLRGAGSGRARLEYLEIVRGGAERIFGERLRTSGGDGNVPLPVMATAFAGAHTALLTAWLEDPHRPPAEKMARTELELLGYGFVWGYGQLDARAAELLPPLVG